ncbi:protein S100-A13 isoform X1 [Phasianus colchicus]|uniref:protein S100-A13 isoform X1 n=2 Tax=Phasianus colchicus TaxID=9054 RepID=UPI00129E6A18|nr:protein S100-A13 isoform X1 [Phasianus colchicus]
MNRGVMGSMGQRGTAFPSHMCPHFHKSKAEPGKHWGKGWEGAHTLHPTTIWVAQCSECALGPHGSPISHPVSPVPGAGCARRAAAVWGGDGKLLLGGVCNGKPNGKPCTGLRDHALQSTTIRPRRGLQLTGDISLPIAPMAAAELTPVEMAIETVVTVFVSHTKKEGRMGTMTATAFQELLRLQLPNVMKDVPSLEEQMRMLDVSTDQELTFEEFWQLMGELVRALWREREGRKK